MPRRPNVSTPVQNPAPYARCRVAIAAAVCIASRRRPRVSQSPAAATPAPYASGTSSAVERHAGSATAATIDAIINPSIVMTNGA